MRSLSFIFLIKVLVKSINQFQIVSKHFFVRTCTSHLTLFLLNAASLRELRVMIQNGIFEAKAILQMYHARIIAALLQLFRIVT